MTEDEARDLKLDGKAARRDGLTRDDNPHPIGTTDHNRWDEGWLIQDIFSRESDNADRSSRS